MGIDFNGLNARNATTQQSRSSQNVVSKTTDKSAGSAASGASSAENTVKISDDAKSLQQMQGQFSKEPVVDDAKVASIKTAINDGSYQVDANKLAGNMLDNDSFF